MQLVNKSLIFTPHLGKILSIALLSCLDSVHKGCTDGSSDDNELLSQCHWLCNEDSPCKHRVLWEPILARNVCGHEGVHFLHFIECQTTPLLGAIFADTNTLSQLEHVDCLHLDHATVNDCINGAASCSPLLGAIFADTNTLSQ